MTFSASRRRFLLAGSLLGGGLLLGYGLFKPRDLLGGRDLLPLSGDEVALNAWLKIDSSGITTVAVPRAEMGQGVYTALAMLVAEELDLAWQQVRVEQSPIDAVYGNVVAIVDSSPLSHRDDGILAQSVRWSLGRAARVIGLQVTGGSTSVRDAWLPMRTAGAAARQMLIAAAAARLNVAPDQLTTDAGSVIDGRGERRLAYGALAQEAAQLNPPSTIEFRDPGNYRLLGQPLPRLDVPAKVDGSAEFGIDVRLPDMLYAAIMIAPVVGGRLAEYDTAALESAAGVVKVVTFDDAIAVVADSYWRAQNALTRADIRFEDGVNGTLNSEAIFTQLSEALDRDDGYAYEDVGDALSRLDGPQTQAAEYRVPLLAHACMEPMNCTARVEADGAEIWCGNQAPDLLRLLAARALNVDSEQVRIHTPMLGGGFGRRSEADVMLRALGVARQLPGRAVQLIYSREQDMQHDTYRPAVMSRFRARLDDQGNISAWYHHIASPAVSQAVIGRAFPNVPLGGPDKTNTEGAAFLPYAVAHRRVEHSKVTYALPIGFWRSVGHSYNGFFTECFIDELAAAAGIDAIEFRLKHLRHRERETRVLELARDLSQWRDPAAPGRARGVALHESFHSIVAQVAEVSNDAGQIRVHRVVCVIDCGQVVNPDTVIAQMESGIVFGLSAALYGNVRVAEGRIQQRNFPDYRVLDLAHMPLVESHVVQSGAPPGGVGEPGTPPIAPAVANALAALTGERARALPLMS